MNTLVHRRESRARRLLAALALAIVAALALPTVAGATDYSVNDDSVATDAGPPGANCGVGAETTIQGGVNLADPGDRVLVCEGTYTTGLDGSPAAQITDPNVDLLGVQAGQDGRSGRVGAAEASVEDPDGGFVVQANDTTIDGFLITDAVQNFMSGIQLQSGTSDHQVTNNILADNGEGIAMANGAAAQTIIAFNLFDANNGVFGNGIAADLGPTHNVLITLNRFVDHQNAGIIFQSTQTSPGFNSNIEILANQFDNTNPDDSFNENRIVLLSTSNALIQGNALSNNANNAIQLLGANQNVGISNNRIADAGFSGVRINVCTVASCGAQFAPNSNVEVRGNTLLRTRDTVGNEGAGIKIADGAYAGALQASFNRIVGNDRGIQLDDSDESVNANNNWWGCNGGPNAPGCDTLFGATNKIAANPFLVLRVFASPPGPLSQGGTSSIVASLQTNNLGQQVGAGFPNATPIGFATTLGSITPTALTSNGGAVSIFTGTVPGTAIVNASLDNQTVGTGIGVLGSTAAQRSGRCKNRKTGGSGSDDLIGSGEGDRLKGKGGDDRLRGRGGDDCLNGGTENDRLRGGGGEDLLKGGAGDDVINAKDGKFDKVRCGFGSDRAIVDAVDTVKVCEKVN